MLKKPSSWLFVDAFYLKKLGEEVKKQGENDRKEYGCGDRKIESEVLFFYHDVAGELPDERDEKAE
jgi:hypothetical protein